MKLPPYLTQTAVAVLACASWKSAALASPEVPGAAQSQAIAVVGATVHTVSGEVIENGSILFDKGKIVAVGKELDVPSSAERIDAAGKHVYPGLIDANSQLGLVEVPSVRGTRDQSETGQINPNVRACVAFNPDSELIPVGRANGILTALVVPSGGIISGQSACMELDGWTWEDMCLRDGVALHINWPRMSPLRGWWIDESGSSQIEGRDRAIRTIRTAFADARAYRAAKEAHRKGGAEEPTFDARWEAMIPVLDGKIPLFVEADDVEQIQAAVAFAAKEGLRITIVGGQEAPECTALLSEHDVPVIVTGTHRLPRRRGDSHDAPFRVPAKLQEAGIRYCISGVTKGSPGTVTPNVRNLPYHAATAVAHGLSPAEAIKAITLFPAEILGLEERLGSLDKGKDATLIVTTGDPLEITTQVERAYIQGREVELNDRQKRLWKKYQEKYRRQDATSSGALAN